MKEKLAFILSGMSRIHLHPTIFADDVRRSDRDAFRKDLERIGRDFGMVLRREEVRQTEERVVPKPRRRALTARARRRG